MQLAGVAGASYEIGLWNAGTITSVDGGILTKEGKLKIAFPPASDETYVHQTVTIHFSKP